ncbi:MAG: S1C family serine protease [Trebonia sp.]
MSAMPEMPGEDAVTGARLGGQRRWIPWAAVVMALAVGGCTGSATGSASSSQSPSASGSAGSAASTASSCAVTNVADQVIPSVVTIAVQGASGGGTGSGEVIRSDGYILTNNHVISSAANGGTVEVLFPDGTTVPATITGRDPLTDLAVIKVKPSRQLKVIKLGSSASVRVGEPVVAIGAPLGLSGTVTSGIISALDRTIQVPGENDRSALLVSAIQTDAAINPGNSGGALVNCAGQLIGVPSAGASVPSSSGESSGGNIGLGFAIPVDLAKSVSDEIIATGKVTHAFFGVQTLPIPPEAAAQAGVSEGLYVEGVVADGPAARAGLRTGDVITSVEGEPATSNTQLQELTLTKKPGDQVSIGYERGGKRQTATVTMAAQR